jgi:hypothetical protein
MTRVYAAKDPPDAHLMVAYLAAHGIDAEVEGEALWGARGDLPLGSAAAPQVLVDDADADRARELITTRPKHQSHCTVCGYDLTGLPQPRCPECGTPSHRPVESGPSWVCSGCGETIEPQFTACWSCGAERKTT